MGRGELEKGEKREGEFGVVSVSVLVLACVRVNVRCMQVGWGNGGWGCLIGCLLSHFFTQLALVVWSMIKGFTQYFT